MQMVVTPGGRNRASYLATRGLLTGYRVNGIVRAVNVIRLSKQNC